MTYYYCFVKDCSDAAIRDKSFHEESRKLMEDFKNEVKQIDEQLIKEEPEAKSEIIYFSWEGWCVRSSERNLDSYSELESGVTRGGPEEVVDVVHYNLNLSDDKNKIKLMYIVSNDDDSGAICSAIKDQIKCETFAFYTFHNHSSKVSSMAAEKSVAEKNLELDDEDSSGCYSDDDKLTIEYFFYQDLKSDQRPAKMAVILDVQGFRGPNNVFIVKELAAVVIQSDIKGLEEISCTIFQPPYHWKKLSMKDQRQNVWLTQNYHGIAWKDGTTPYSQVEDTLNYVTRDKKYAYVKGSEKKSWAENIIGYNKNVIDLDELMCPSLQSFNNTKKNFCRYHCSSNHSCALNNVITLKNWFLDV